MGKKHPCSSKQIVCARADLDKGHFAGADIARFVFDDHLAIVLQPALLTQHVVDARHGLVPFIVITIAAYTSK